MNSRVNYKIENQTCKKSKETLKFIVVSVLLTKSNYKLTLKSYIE